MANFIHKELAAGRWFTLSLCEQLANVGSEAGRARIWQGKDEERFRGAVDRALDLLDLTLEDPRWRGARRVEIARVRELFCAAVLGDNEYHTSLEDIERYCMQFAVAARAALEQK